MTLFPGLRPSAALPVLMLLASCAGPISNSDPMDTVAGYAPLSGRNTGSGMVLSGPDLTQYGGTLLTYLRSRVSGMVVRSSAHRPCPEVILRGRKSIVNSSSPLIYVNGTRAANSCVLNMLPTRGLHSVEVYPMGVSTRPGYAMSATGLILVFLQDGRS